MTDVTGFLIPIIAAAIGFAILYLIIRGAVTTALRDHQEWLEERAPTPKLPAS
ncbi:MAG: hypothetical protein ABI632_09535 [Pseudolysinimonas sp.]